MRIFSNNWLLIMPIIDKGFNIKIFDSLGTTLKTTIKPDIVKTNPTFRSKINGNIGEMLIDLNLDFDDFGEGNAIDYMNIVRVFEVDSQNPEGRLIYTGVISEYTPYLSGSEQGVLLTLLALGSLLQNDFYKNGASFTVTHTNDDPQVIMKAIVDHFNTVYSGSLLSYGAGNTTIDNVGTNVTKDFINRRWLDALNDAFELAGGDWYWRIGNTGLVFLQKKPSTATHTFTINEDVEQLAVKKSSEEVINKVHFTFNGGSVDVSDATSITTFGARGNVTDDQTITDSGTATQRANQILNDNKNEKIKATLKINAQFDIESVIVGDTCKVRNLKLGSTVFDSNMQIVEFTYNWDSLTLKLEGRDSFADTVISVQNA